LYTTIGNQSTELIVSVNGPGSIIALFSENPTHGEAQSSPPGIWYQLFNNPALANPYVQVGGVSSIIVIILASVYLGIKRSFTKE
jgi:hypothetical protein